MNGLAICERVKKSDPTVDALCVCWRCKWPVSIPIEDAVASSMPREVIICPKCYTDEEKQIVSALEDMPDRHRLYGMQFRHLSTRRDN